MENEIEDTNKDESTHAAAHPVGKPRTLLNNVAWTRRMIAADYPDLIYLSPAGKKRKGLAEGK
jgi:hypothetical protein